MKINTIRNEGGSRVLTVTKIIPADWKIIQFAKVVRKNGTIILTINKVQ